MRNIKTLLGTKLLHVQKHSPKLLFAAGVIGFGATVVLAARATLKVEEVFEKHDADMNKIQKARALDPDIYQESNAQQDKVIVYTKTAVSLVRLYGPAVVVGGLSVAALTGSHVILSNRVSNLTAAYAVLDKGFRTYRQRVVEEFGEQKDAEFRYGAEEHEIIEETPEGPVVKTVKRAHEGKSIYARWFDEGSVNWGRHPLSNQTFLNSQQNYLNDLLQAQGYVFLNDVYIALGLPISSEGQMVGWFRDNPRGGDGYISFGIFENDLYTAKRWINGDDQRILLDFNVDGVIYDLIGKKKND